MILPDSVLWIDFMRAKTPAAVKQLIAPYLASRNTVLSEPVRFEVMRGERKTDRLKADNLLKTVPIIRTPALLWQNAEKYGQMCLDTSLVVPPLDLLIAATTVEHNAEIVTYDKHFAAMQQVIPKLRARVLARP